MCTVSPCFVDVCRGKLSIYLHVGWKRAIYRRIIVINILYLLLCMLCGRQKYIFIYSPAFSNTSHLVHTKQFCVDITLCKVSWCSASSTICESKNQWVRRKMNVLCEGSKFLFIFSYFELLELLNHENRRLGRCAQIGDNIKTYI
jgi:hypothetical protein